MNLNKNQKIGIGIAAAILIIAGLFLANQRKDHTDNSNTITVSNFDECVAAGNPVMESYPAQCRTADGQTFTQDIGNEMEKRELIRVDNPRPNQLISSGFEIKGEARGNWYFEASFPAKLIDANNKELAVMPIQAQGEWMTTNFVPFRATMNFSTPTTATGKLILQKSNASGLPEHDDQLIIPVRFGETSADKTIVQAFFGNSSKGAECEEVAAVSRAIDKTPRVGQAALEELLEGPSEIERGQGYTTAINAGTRLLSLRIENGIAYADFNDELGKNVAGSCRVNAIRAQITDTLKQFSTVSQVQISINGKTEGILQP